MKIAFDVDGVLTKFIEYEKVNGKKFFNKTDDQINEKEINFKKMFNCSKEEEKKFWEKYIWKYCLKEPSRKGMSELTKKLKNDNDEIYIVTARTHTTEKNARGSLFRKMLTYWLKKEDICYDHIIYCNEETSNIDKAKICVDEGIDVIIDDESKNILSLSDVTNVIYLEENHNKNCEGERIKKVFSVNEIYNQIESIRSKGKKLKK